VRKNVEKIAENVCGKCGKKCGKIANGCIGAGN
jgi:hypothetical protein